MQTVAKGWVAPKVEVEIQYCGLNDDMDPYWQIHGEGVQWAVVTGKLGSPDANRDMAAFGEKMVRAVNVHDELVAALVELRRFVEDATPIGRQIDAALAKAGVL